jgi:hypothetical protein
MEIVKLRLQRIKNDFNNYITQNYNTVSFDMKGDVVKMYGYIVLSLYILVILVSIIKQQ